MKTILAFLLISIYGFSCTQRSGKDVSLTCTANWKKGDKKVLFISRRNEDHKPGQRGSTFDLFYEAHITVLDSSKDGYTIRWVFQLTDAYKKANPYMVGSLPIYEGLKMIFTTTHTGAFKELINWQEVKESYVAMMEVSLPKNLTDSVKAAIKKSNDFFNSREMVEGALIREIQIYYAPYGGDYATKEARSGILLPNPFGDEPLPAIVTQKISKVSSRHFTVSVAQELDSTGASILMNSMFNKMDIPVDSILAEPGSMLSNFQMKDRIEYKVDRSTGWITAVKNERTAITSGKKKTETFHFTMK